MSSGNFNINMNGSVDQDLLDRMRAVQTEARMRQQGQHPDQQMPGSWTPERESSARDRMQGRREAMAQARADRHSGMAQRHQERMECHQERLQGHHERFNRTNEQRDTAQRTQEGGVHVPPGVTNVNMNFNPAPGGPQYGGTLSVLRSYTSC